MGLSFLRAGVLSGRPNFCSPVACSGKCLLAVLACVCVTAAIPIICNWFPSYLPWSHTSIWHHQVCWKGMPWNVAWEGTTVTGINVAWMLHFMKSVATSLHSQYFASSTILYYILLIVSFLGSAIGAGSRG